MQHYAAHIEMTRRGSPTADEVDRYMDALAAYHPSISESPHGHLAFTITVPGDSLAQATSIALAVAAQAAGEPLTIEIQPEAVRDGRAGYVPVPELIGIADAAAILGKSQQRVHQMIAEGKLAAHRIGERGIALVRTEVEAHASGAAASALDR